MALITDINISPKKPRPGQPVSINVLSNHKKLNVFINNIPKSSVTIQFAKEGEQNIVVTAVHGKERERKTITITVAGDPLTINTGGGNTMPILRATTVPNAPYKAALSIGASYKAKPTAGLSSGGLGGIVYDHVFGNSLRGNQRVIGYLWDFGDGKTQKTKSLTIEHDYSSSITPKKEVLVFTVKCTPLLKNKSKHPVGTLTRTLVFHSIYALLRNRGFIHPPVSADEMVTVGRSLEKPQGALPSWFATFSATNIESEAIELTGRAITPVSLDPDGINTHTIFRPLRGGPITIAPGDRRGFHVEIPMGTLPKRTGGIEIRFGGKSKSGIPVQIAAIFDIPMIDRRRPSDSVVTVIDDENNGNAVLFNVVYDDTCNRANISTEDAADAAREGLVCQVTDEMETITMPARFVNARKGDIILSPGGSGLIGSLLAQIDPVQRYSHCGIMTSNFDEIAHSTASTDWLYDHKAGALGGPGFEESALRWMWPGPVIQNIEEAIHGEPWVSPEGVVYEISSFKNRAVDEDFVVTPPLVIKPHPALDTPNIRARLHSVADEARRTATRPGEEASGHYSLYCYSRARTGLDEIAPSTAGWAENTFPSMCSSFIWLMARRQGVQFESPNSLVMEEDLEALDIDDYGAEVNDETLDGLYHYDEWERQNAGNWLNERVKKEVRNKTPGSTFLGSPRRYANQVCNTFAYGDASRSARRDDAWENPGSGTTVSPDNLLLWDGPDLGGLWGYAEPLLYREPREETVRISRWRRVTNLSSVTGSIALDGRPMPNADVQLNSIYSDITDENGRFEIEDVPYGPYTVTASHSATGTSLTAGRFINVNRPSMRIDLNLTPPPEQYRLASINLDFVGFDDEILRRRDLRVTRTARLTAELGPDRITNEVNQSWGWGGEVYVKYTFSIQLILPQNEFQVTILGQMWEGIRERKSDLADTQETIIYVPADGRTPFFLRLYNDERWGGDWAEIRGTIRNVRNVT